MDTIGEQLKQARLQQGLTIDDLQRITKIQRRYLSAIEENDFDAIPSDYYTRTFIRQFATAVGVNPTPLVKRFDNTHTSNRQVEQPVVTQVTQVSEPLPLRASRKEKYAQQNKQEAKKGVYIPVIILVIIVAIIVGTIIYAIRLDTAQGPLVPKPDKTTIMGSDQSSTKEKESSTKEKKEETKEDEKKKEDKKENIFTLESDYGDVITYKGVGVTQPVTVEVSGLEGPSWIGVQESGTGNLFYQETVQAGESLTIDIPESIQNMDIIVGAANNITLKVNGKAINFNEENPVTGTKSITLLLSSEAASDTDVNEDEDTQISENSSEDETNTSTTNQNGFE